MQWYLKTIGKVGEKYFPIMLWIAGFYAIVALQTWYIGCIFFEGQTFLLISEDQNTVFEVYASDVIFIFN